MKLLLHYSVMSKGGRIIYLKDPSEGAFVVRGDHNTEDKKGNMKKKGPKC